MPPETISIRPADLLVDEQNPRIPESGEGQHRALQAVASFKPQKLLVLARDIVAHGLNPSETTIVVPADDPQRGYVVLEGNRRLVALRVLENPEALGDSVPKALLAEYRRLSKAYHQNPIEHVRCLVVTSRKEARHWVELRHTGENEGAGVVAWGSDESARFRARTGRAEVHSQALQFLQDRGHLTAQDRSKVPATSFKRLLQTPEVRAKVGIEVDEGKIRLLADAEKVAGALLHIVSDLTSRRITVSGIYHKADRVAYADRLPARVVVAATKKAGQGVPIPESNQPSAAKQGPRSVARLSPPRIKLIPRDCLLTVTEPRLAHIARELRGLNLDEYPNAVSVLFRVFLELSVDWYVKSAGLPVASDRQPPLARRLRMVMEDLEGKNKLSKAEAKPVRRALEGDSFLAPSVLLMQAYVHSRNVFPAPSDLRASWDSLQPFITAIWTP